MRRALAGAGLRGKRREVLARHPPLACRPSPPRGRRSNARPPSPISAVAVQGAALELPISLLEGEMSGRPEGVPRLNNHPLLSGIIRNS
ncbi:hypothetical protein EN817_12310 [Mesorhizobium sp. M3A.F.Ca.ET.174.01.1.1]|nr:hypothetical protein EJ074_15810 [Mesorhizobium sp. M3A.F.Ca.ET.080.04.2.1]RWB69087.1 MAG: hypothetical protein EOQ49_20840 [Mesorhizobium sp.]TGS69137.1 hypothetical protein EN844_09720 [Mesorhizobium sp. M3A.F.Ca.ET.201.01.1.1]TGS87005.1 hypothetical protein EN818_12310 [Mesorhizobium sp. M3A.F.Ca.ET.175.01.1.1]TGT26836.1 hypothetical protein EN817_12310 [Mesorhizobium sp. M3A.F.Ca.ET.174.01.1.1]TGT60466.1 hypothetical protein EN813_022495 [Mesorhizobium sp. M00.F.Ca.ET.170.01.1.1]